MTYRGPFQPILFQPKLFYDPTSCPHVILAKNTWEWEKQATHPVFKEPPCIIAIRSSLRFVDKRKVHVNIKESDCKERTEVRYILQLAEKVHAPLPISSLPYRTMVVFPFPWHWGSLGNPRLQYPSLCYCCIDRNFIKDLKGPNTWSHYHTLTTKLWFMSGVHCLGLYCLLRMHRQRQEDLLTQDTLLSSKGLNMWLSLKLSHLRCQSVWVTIMTTFKMAPWALTWNGTIGTG